jgi:hypothetical protein
MNMRMDNGHNMAGQQRRLKGELKNIQHETSVERSSYNRYIKNNTGKDTGIL